MKKLSKARVLITGASAGIGASLAAFLAEKGMHVTLTARREKRLKAIAREIYEHGGSCDVLVADLSDEADRERLIHSVRARSGPIDVLVNNAGFGWYGFFKDMPWGLAKQMAEVNMLSVVHLTNLVLPEMLRRGQGHIINISSIAGGLPNQGIAVYSGSKSFIDAFSTSLFREYHTAGLVVSTMRLGPVETEFFQQAQSKPNGRRVPSEKLSISTERINQAVWRLLKRPRRVMYVPGWLRVTRHVENVFGSLIDLLGPLLLNWRHD